MLQIVIGTHPGSHSESRAPGASTLVAIPTVCSMHMAVVHENLEFDVHIGIYFARIQTNAKLLRRATFRPVPFVSATCTVDHEPVRTTHERRLKVENT